MHATWFSSTFPSFLKCPEIKEGEDLISWGEPILENSWITWYLLELLEPNKIKKLDHVINTNWLDQVKVLRTYRNIHHKLCHEIVWSHFQYKKYSWLSTTATVMQLNLKDDFLYKFVYLYNYFILCFSSLKSR